MESLEVLNQRLKDIFGYFDGINANYRLAWSDDLFEKRRVDKTDEGFALLYPEIKLQKKYNYIKERYILEKLIPTPETNHQDLTENLTYECIWTFEDKNGNPLPPKWNAIEFLIDSLHKQLGKKQIYKDPEVGSTPEETAELKRARINKLYEDLYGNETPTGDALAYGSGVSIPHNYERKPVVVTNPLRMKELK